MFPLLAPFLRLSISSELLLSSLMARCSQDHQFQELIYRAHKKMNNNPV
jgi:hypothetical protein